MLCLLFFIYAVLLKKIFYWFYFDHSSLNALRFPIPMIWRVGPRAIFQVCRHFPCVAEFWWINIINLYFYPSDRHYKLVCLSFSFLFFFFLEKNQLLLASMAYLYDFIYNFFFCLWDQTGITEALISSLLAVLLTSVWYLREYIWVHIKVHSGVVYLHPFPTKIQFVC